MAFVTLEKQIVDKVTNHLFELECLAPISIRRYMGSPDCNTQIEPPKFTWNREYSLSNGRRIDLLGTTRNRRVNWVVEFKLHATASALVQVQEYAESYSYTIGLPRIRRIEKAIIAQSFDRETLYLARRLRTQVIQFVEVTNEEFFLEQLVGPNERESEIRKGRTGRRFYGHRVGGI